ncbi:MAG: hypothetical protein KBT87_07240 [Gammaproteobacteria bacterium]|nr:hypothetical protein [Gammaproteobacteria bacterium]MBQ0774445.1 hypothetical protein [Gammaproteobacteria bacterium]|tara:strand:- start:51009 stop:51299 length:291 start_codon:yes stop_codon:yes gene_type:complete
MNNAEAYKEKYSAKLDEWKAEIDKLKARAVQEKSDASISLREKVDELEKKRDEAKKQLEKLSNAGNDAWEDLKSGVEKACTDLSGSIKAAMHKFDK